MSLSNGFSKYCYTHIKSLVEQNVVEFVCITLACRPLVQAGSCSHVYEAIHGIRRQTTDHSCTQLYLTSLLHTTIYLHTLHQRGLHHDPSKVAYLGQIGN